MEPESQSPPGGLPRLSALSRVVVAVALAVVVVATAVHLGMVFLHVAPSNTVSKRHDALIDDYVLPEFEQNWKLFAPNPLQSNIAVHARAEVRRPDGTTVTTRWRNLTAMDIARIRGNPFPSHTAQNELRRAWDFFTGSHDEDNQPLGERGELSEQYLRRIVMRRLGAELDGGVVEKIQVRSATRLVAPPAWSGEKADSSTEYRVLPWWVVTTADLPQDDRERREARSR